MADPLMIKMLNQMNHIGAKRTVTAKHWRIPHGTNDKDTDLAIPVILGACLQNKGYNLSSELPWNKSPSGDCDLAELFAWVDPICR